MNNKTLSNCEEATFLKILRPQTAALGKVFDAWITASSAPWQRLAVVQLTRYLCLETKYRQDMDDLAITWEKNKTAVFALTEYIASRDGNEHQALVGIMTFQQFGKNPTLYHCYLHPFFRGKGRMRTAWQNIQHRYPQFEIELPQSPAMERFLIKVDCTCILPTT